MPLFVRRRLPAFAALGAASAILVLGAGQPVAAAEDGHALFDANCSACHQPDGKGIPGAFPALAGDAFVVGPAEAPASVVLNGRGGMPTFKADLNDEQIAAILTYVRSSWGNQAPAVTPQVVAAQRAGTAPPPAAPLMKH